MLYFSDDAKTAGIAAFIIWLPVMFFLKVNKTQCKLDSLSTLFADFIISIFCLRAQNELAMRNVDSLRL